MPANSKPAFREAFSSDWREIDVFFPFTVQQPNFCALFSREEWSQTELHFALFDWALKPVFS